MDNPRIISLVERLRNPDFESSGQSLKSGGGGGTYDDMEERVKHLETDVAEIKADLKTLVKDVSEMKGRLSAMPTTWQIVGLIFAILAGAWAIIRFGL